MSCERDGIRKTERRERGEGGSAKERKKGEKTEAKRITVNYKVSTKKEERRHTEREYETGSGWTPNVMKVCQ